MSSGVQFDAGTDEPRNGERELSVPGSQISKPTKRQRWATTRANSTRGMRKRVSIMDRLHKHHDSKDEKHKSGGTTTTGGGSGDGVGDDNVDRRVYFNVPLPESERDEEGFPINNYPRNKIRTAKYTALTFIPKNIWLQFHNIANMYFLFVIILNIPSIFGANNPGLNAVPLIVIVVVTAIKDAIEDWSRTVLDNELNNSPVYRLVDWNNVNSTQDNVSLWRRFKKACTRATVATYRFSRDFINEKRGIQPAEAANDSEARRLSVISTAASPRPSTNPPRDRPLSNRDQGVEDGAIQMTPVSSPNPEARHEFDVDTATPGNEHGQYLHPDKAARNSGAPASGASSATPPKKGGSVLDMAKQTPQTARFKRDYWKNVQVGDFVRLYNGDPIPADVVVLSTSDLDGACYVETKNLDGETNLKVRHALNCGRQVRHARDCEKAEFIIESEAPTANLYTYTGSIRWDQRDPEFPDAPRKEMVEPITINNMLLRGCSLRNTEWVLGIVVFTGAESKIMLNSGITPSKRARLAKDLNWNVIYNFVILFLMCLVMGIINGCAWAANNKSLNYFDYGAPGNTTPPVTGIVTFWVAVVLFQNLVPISLYISLEIVRTIQAVFIHYDVYMYYERLELACVPKTWNISDDVGQIEYIFSDKTGTLTQNVMEFKKCTVNGVAYGEAYTEAQAGMRRREVGGAEAEAEVAQAREKIASETVKMLAMLRDIHDNPYLRDENLTFVSSPYVSDLMGQSGEEQKAATEHFMVALAVCHTVITEQTPGDPPQIEFKAQSPDEAALVSAARDCGYTVIGRTGDDLIVNVMGEERTYTVLNTLEFNSSRKRMSAIIRMPDGSIRLFCKGADSIIYSRLAEGKQQELRRSTADHLERFAQEGLRTLCVADRKLTEEEYQAWSREHDVAAAALTDREEKLEQVSSAIEQDLMLIGGTAIEDRLQDGVPDTISLLAEAGIKLWVLTGDKVETAINIGFSCNLLNNDMDLIVFNVPESQPETAAQELDKQLQAFGLTGSDEELMQARKDHTPPAPTHAVVIDGDTLKLMLSEELKQKFLLLCKQCRSVLCCRVSPAQKAAVVKLVKNGLNIMALSIGDGANDVAMIQEADVGVGIAGEEGRQAAMSSDYAIGQFRFLQRLILVHGRYSYRRMGETIANFFYKNLVWTFALFWYCIYNDFDGSYLFDYTYIVLVNVAFTSLPVIFMGILDQDVDDKVSLAVPQLYMRGIERKEWSQLKFWLYMFDGLYQSLICYFLPYLLYRPANFATSNGLNVNDRTRMGILVATAAVIASNTYIVMNTYRWDWLTVLINVISSLLIFIWTGIYSSLTASGQFYHSAAEVYGTLSFWVVLLITVLICLLPRFTIKAFQKVFFPYDVDIVREWVSMGKYKYLEDQDEETYVPPAAAAAPGPPGDGSATSSDLGKSIAPSMKQDPFSDDHQAMYAPSVARSTHKHNPRSQNGSNGTNYTDTHSLDVAHYPPHPQPVDYVRNPTEGTRHSFDRDYLPSYEATYNPPQQQTQQQQQPQHYQYHQQSETSKPPHESPFHSSNDPPMNFL